MKRLVILVLAVMVMAGCKMDDLTINFYFKEYQQMMWPTVRVSTAEGNCGSGVVIETTDYTDETQISILTAAHVIGNNSDATIEIFTTECTEIEAIVVITDTDKDLALLRAFLPTAKKAYAACLAPKDFIPSLFAPVYAVGCSLGLLPRPSQGIISCIKPYWEVSSPILPGNSGGPVFELRANSYQLIGIAVSVYVYKNQLVTTMAKIIPMQTIYEFLATDFTD